MASKELLVQYPIALEIIKSWKEQNILYHLERDEDVFSVLFPPLNIFDEVDIRELQFNTTFLRQVIEAFPIVMLYYGLLYSDTGIQILNEVRFLIFFVRGIWGVQGGEGEEGGEEGGENEEKEVDPRLIAPRKEHSRINRMLKFLSILQLTYQYELLNDFALQVASDYPDEIAEETVLLWRGE